MELTITLTPEQAAQFEQTGKLTIQKDTVTTVQPVVKWTPRSSFWFINSEGYIFNWSTDAMKLFGNAYQTQEQAKQAVKEIRIQNWIRQFVYEFDADWKADWSNKHQPKWFIYYSRIESQFVPSYYCSRQDPGKTYMSEQCAIKLCDMLNNNQIDLNFLDV